MKKIILSLLLLTAFMQTALEADDNVGFLQNQKYICVCTDGFDGKDKKMIKIQSIEDALKYPTRFYVDDNKILHTDGKIDNKLYYDNKNDAYFSDKSTISLAIEEGRRFMYRLLKTEPFENIILIYTCVETDTWTLVR